MEAFSTALKHLAAIRKIFLQFRSKREFSPQKKQSNLMAFFLNSIIIKGIKLERDRLIEVRREGRQIYILVLVSWLITDKIQSIADSFESISSDQWRGHMISVFNWKKKKKHKLMQHLYNSLSKQMKKRIH